MLGIAYHGVLGVCLGTPLRTQLAISHSFEAEVLSLLTDDRRLKPPGKMF